MTIPLQSSIVYGPLRSRRFGVSLGINLLPVDQKVCNFDCVYCQYDRSEAKADTAFPTVQEIESATVLFLKTAAKNNGAIDWITIAGNGEPTLHPQFGETVVRLLSLRNKFLKKVRIGILSNSSTCHRSEVRRALRLLDGRFMKLDAGDPSIFNDVNRPAGSDGWGEMVEGLRDLGDTVLQSLFFDGNQQNIASPQIHAWIRLVERIQPRSVQIYTLDRPAQCDGLQRVPVESLQDIADRLISQTGIPGLIF